MQSPCLVPPAAGSRSDRMRCLSLSLRSDRKRCLSLSHVLVPCPCPIGSVACPCPLVPLSLSLLSLKVGPFPARQRRIYWEPVVTCRGGIPGVLEIDELHLDFRRIGYSLFTLLRVMVGGVMGDLSSLSHAAGSAIRSRARTKRPSSASGAIINSRPCQQRTRLRLL